MPSRTTTQKPMSAALVATVIIIGMLGFLELYSIQSILPVLQDAFHADAVSIGYPIASAVIGMGLLSPFIGMISDKIGRTKIIYSSLFILAITTILMAFCHNLEQLIIIRFIQGMAIPGLTVVFLAYLAEENDHTNLPKIMSIYTAATVVGGFLGRFFLGYLTIYLDWRLAHIILGSGALVAGIIATILIPKSRNFKPIKNMKLELLTLVHHLKDRKLIITYILALCFLCSLLGCFTYINLYLAAPPFNLSAIGLSNIFVVYLVGALVTPFASILIANIGNAKTVALAMLVSIIGILLTYNAYLILIIVGLALMCSGIFIAQTAVLNFMAIHVRKGRSLASGIYNFFYYTGGAIGNFACGYAFHYQHWLGVVVFVVAVELIAILVSFGLKEKKATLSPPQ